MGMGFSFGVMSVWNETEVEAAPHCECAKCHCILKWFILCYVNFSSMKINNKSNGFEEPPKAPGALVSQSDCGHLAGWEAKVGGLWWHWHPTLGSGPDGHGAPRPGEASLSLASLLWIRAMNRISGYQAGGRGLNCDTAQLPHTRQARGPALRMQAHPLLTNSLILCSLPLKGK